jgi:hypothetical protein
MKIASSRDAQRRWTTITAPAGFLDTAPPAAPRTFARRGGPPGRGKRQRLINLYADGAISKAEFHQRIDALEQAKRDLDALLPANAPALDARQTARAVAEFFVGFEDQSFEHQRRTLRSAFKEFRIDNGAITGWTLNRGFLGGMAKLSSPSRSLYLLRCTARALPARLP